MPRSFLIKKTERKSVQRCASGQLGRPADNSWSTSGRPWSPGGVRTIQGLEDLREVRLDLVEGFDRRKESRLSGVTSMSSTSTADLFGYSISSDYSYIVMSAETGRICKSTIENDNCPDIGQCHLDVGQCHLDVGQCHLDVGQCHLDVTESSVVSNDEICTTSSDPSDISDDSVDVHEHRSLLSASSCSISTSGPEHLFISGHDRITGSDPDLPKPLHYTFDLISDGRFKKRIGSESRSMTSSASSSSSSSSPMSPTRPSYVCDECGRHYATSSNLSRHRQTHRSLDSQHAKQCPHCRKVYVSMPALAMHVLTHDLKYRCTVCDKAFSRPWLLRGHLRSHTGEKPFGCVHCGKAFADRSNLRAHMQTHSAMRHYHCERCKKSFALKSYLNKHSELSCTAMEPN